MGEESSEIVGLGVLEVEVEISSELDRREEMKALEGSEEVVENGDPAAVDPKVEQKLAAAERRYEGALAFPLKQMCTDKMKPKIFRKGSLHY